MSAPLSSHIQPLSSRIQESVRVLAERLTAKQLRVATAESCTGGLLAQWFTSQDGSSQWFECGFVTYSNDSKRRLLAVSADALDQYGAVSENVAEQMALGVLQNSTAELAGAITGIAGPTGGSATKPTGTVYIAVADRHRDPQVAHHLFDGDRQAVREQAVHATITQLTQYLE